MIWFNFGVIIPDILNHFFAKVLYSIEKEASSRGYNIITCLSNESFDKEMKSLELLSNGSVDGFIVSVAEESQIGNKTNHFWWFCKMHMCRDLVFVFAQLNIFTNSHSSSLLSKFVPSFSI